MFSPQSLPGRSSVTVKQVATSVCILRPRSGLSRKTSSDLSAAVDEAIRHGADDIVVELGAMSIIDADVVELLQAMAETLLARDSLLWLAAPWPDGRGHTLRPVRDVGPDALRGVSDALDLALANQREDVRPRRLDAG